MPCGADAAPETERGAATPPDRPVEFRAFAAADQAAARALVLEGLGEHWGSIDETLNPDLREIARSYAAGYFACGFESDVLVATGAFLPVSTETIRIHRMSVAGRLRRRGVGSDLLGHLLQVARERGFTRAMLETTETWGEVIAFYGRHGFRPYEQRDGDLYLRRDL